MPEYESFWVDIMNSWNYAHTFTVGLVLLFITFMYCIKYRYRISGQGITPEPTFQETPTIVFLDLFDKRLTYDKNR